MKRSYNLDLMRVFLCLSVIVLHSIVYFGSMSKMVGILFPVFLAQANGAFYLLSGYFNLEKRFESSKDIKKYYKNKIIYILLPFVIFVAIWLIWEYVHTSESFNFIELLYLLYDSVMNSSAKTHLWFMYPLFGFLLATPFLSKMLHSMDEKELSILWNVCLWFNIVYYFFCLYFDVPFKATWFLDGWAIYYIAGYHYRHVLSKENKYKWIIIGLIGYVITILGKTNNIPFITNFSYATDLQPMFTLFCLGCLAFWDKMVKINNEKLGKIIVFISKYTFLIYMFHMRAIGVAVKVFSITQNSLLNGILVVVTSFFISLIAAYIMDFALKPIQKFIDKKWSVQ